MPENEDIEELKRELKKLRPGDRLKKLRELEEKRKTEMTEIEDLIKDSEKELRTEKVAENIAPERDEADISRLFKEEPAQLEIAVNEEAHGIEEGDQKYASIKQLYNDYSALQNIAYASMEGELTDEHKEAIDAIGERLDRTRYVSSSNEIANILVASRATLHKIKKYAGLD